MKLGRIPNGLFLVERQVQPKVRYLLMLSIWPPGLGSP